MFHSSDSIKLQKSFGPIALIVLPIFGNLPRCHFPVGSSTACHEVHEVRTRKNIRIVCKGKPYPKFSFFTKVLFTKSGQQIQHNHYVPSILLKTESFYGISTLTSEILVDRVHEDPCSHRFVQRIVCPQKSD